MVLCQQRVSVTKVTATAEGITIEEKACITKQLACCGTCLLECEKGLDSLLRISGGMPARPTNYGSTKTTSSKHHAELQSGSSSPFPYLCRADQHRAARGIPWQKCGSRDMREVHVAHPIGLGALGFKHLSVGWEAVSRIGGGCATAWRLGGWWDGQSLCDASYVCRTEWCRTCLHHALRSAH
jgi:hypothetical protein